MLFNAWQEYRELAERQRAELQAVSRTQEGAHAEAAALREEVRSLSRRVEQEAAGRAQVRKDQKSIVKAFFPKES